MRRQFNLRGCRAFTPGEADYKHCLYAHLKYCTAPCVGNVTREQYLEQVLAACDFLEGQCREMKEQLEAEMKKAAAAQDFEKAAGLRDLIRDLKETTKKERKIRARALHAAAFHQPGKRFGRTGEGARSARTAAVASKASTFPTSAARSPWRRW